MSSIDKSVSASSQQQAIVTKYGFAVTMNGGFIEVTDDVVKKYYVLRDASKKGLYQAKSLDAALKAAVEVRQEYEAEIAKKNGNGNGKNGNGKPTGRVLPAQQPPKAADSKQPTKPQGKAAPKAEAGDKKAPPVEIEGAELDTTGKRVRSRKKREPKVRQPNRYARSSAIIVANLSIDEKSLSKQADMSLSTAGHCLDAWRGIVATLLAKNAIAQSWVKQLQSSVTVVAEQPKKKAAAKK